MVFIYCSSEIKCDVALVNSLPVSETETRDKILVLALQSEYFIGGVV